MDDILLRDVAELAEAARVARQVADAAQEDYLNAVRKAMAGGVPVPQIAEAAKVERTSIYKSLRRRRGDGWGEVQATRETRERDRRLERASRMDDYRTAREADLRAQEERTKGYAGDTAFERACGVRQPINYRQFLEQGGMSA